MKQINVYTFDELTEEAQQKAVTEIAEEYHDNESLHNIEGIVDYWADRLEQLGFEDAEIYFSYTNSQGDGASFTCSNINMDTVINNLILCEQNYKRARGLVSAHKLATDTRYPIEGRITPTSSRYRHEFSVSLDIDFLPCCYPLEEHEKLYWLRDVLERSIEQYRVSLCNAIYKDIVAEHDYHYSAENLAELADINEVCFIENGSNYRRGTL